MFPTIRSMLTPKEKKDDLDLLHEAMRSDTFQALQKEVILRNFKNCEKVIRQEFFQALFKRLQEEMLRLSKGDLKLKEIKATNLPMIKQAIKINQWINETNLSLMEAGMRKFQKGAFLMAGGLGLTRVPPEITQIKGIKEISLVQNYLSFLPDEFKEIKLKGLYLALNFFPSKPKLSNIENVSIDSQKRENRFKLGTCLDQLKNKNVKLPSISKESKESPPTSKSFLGKLAQLPLSPTKVFFKNTEKDSKKL